MDYDKYPNELAHYGILGMKWGVRRYQNEDGTLTAAGKKRYSDKEISDYRKRKIAEAPTKAESPRGANKGWYKYAPKATLVREMRREEKTQVKDKARQEKVQKYINKQRSILQKTINEYIAENPKYKQKGYDYIVDDLSYADKLLSEIDVTTATLKDARHIYKYG